MKPERIAEKDINNPAVRECPKCHNWYSLLGTLDDNGVRRDYNRQPAAKGICTCHLGFK